MPERIPVAVTTPNPQGGTVTQTVSFQGIPQANDIIRVGQRTWMVARVNWTPVREPWEIGVELVLSPLDAPQPQPQPHAHEEDEAPTTRKTRRKTAKAN